MGNKSQLQLESPIGHPISHTGCKSISVWNHLPSSLFSLPQVPALLLAREGISLLKTLWNKNVCFSLVEILSLTKIKAGNSLINFQLRCQNLFAHFFGGVAPKKAQKLCLNCSPFWNLNFEMSEVNFLQTVFLGHDMTICVLPFFGQPINNSYVGKPPC